MDIVLQYFEAVVSNGIVKTYELDKLGSVYFFVPLAVPVPGKVSVTGKVPVTDVTSVILKEYPSVPVPCTLDTLILFVNVTEVPGYAEVVDDVEDVEIVAVGGYVTLTQASVVALLTLG